MSDNDRTPLVLLSGLLCDRFVWQEVAELLADIAETSIVSFAGCSTIAEMAEHVLASTPEQFALAGHSMGGRVALEVIRRQPQRVTHLALLNTGVHPVRDAEIPSRQRLLDLAASDGMAAVADSWLPPMMSSTGGSNSALMRQLREMVQRYTPKQFNGQIHALLQRPDAAAVLPMIRVPTLLLSGDEDQWSPLSQHQDMQQQVPGSRLAALAGVGHMSTVEAPQAVAQALREWLTTR